MDELDRQLVNANSELRDLRLDVGQLKSCNEMLSQENGDLRRQHSSLQDIDSEEDQRPRKRRTKGKNPEYKSEDEMEEDDEETRVCPKSSFNIFLNWPKLIQIYF
jgi:regulator of replication initiation timing